ncbi:MAG TPA: hypothetical protein VMT19_07405 [Thermoanaerobaculaceae bacterium]|nr:hypothetical protein [Thermoanaerobaculaceae bacterium]
MRKLLLSAVVLVLASAPASAAPPAVGDLLHLVPSDAQAIVAIDSATLRAHPLVQSWLERQHAWMATDETLKRFLDDAGLDPVRDVDLLLVAASGEGGEMSGVVFLVGRYDPAALGSALTARGASPIEVAGTPAFRLPDSGRCGAPAVLVQRSQNLVIVGDETAVAATLAAPHAVPPLIAAELAAGSVDLKAPFWMAATVPANLRRRAGEAADHVHGEGSEPVRGALLASGTVQKILIRGYLDDSLRLVGTAVADTAENAGLLRDTAKGILAAARLHAQDACPELVDVLRNVDLSVDGAVLSGTGSVPIALLEKLAAAHAARHSGDEL